MMKLKSLQILLVIFVLAPSAIFAQDEKSIWVNASAGINSIWLINQNAYQNSAMDYASKFGLTGGLGISYYMTDNLGLSASVGYITLGQNYSQTTTLGSASRKVNLSYIQLP
ncbi:MAG: outer membrane beta-barrel protein, partial [Bacteroidota bacterium]